MSEAQNQYQPAGSAGPQGQWNPQSQPGQPAQPGQFGQPTTFGQSGQHGQPSQPAQLGPKGQPGQQVVPSTPGLADGLADASALRSQQPEYGAIKLPEYGALASQFPADYDPYVYGRPDDPKSKDKDKGKGGKGKRSNFDRAVFGDGARPQSRDEGRQRDMRHGIDLNDPEQNPLLGHWDSMSILSFVFAFLIPVISLVLGVIGIWRARRFHMRGIGFAIAGIVLSLLSVAVEVWLMMHGISVEDLERKLLSQIMAGLAGGIPLGLWFPGL
ncbi:hypothetical protein PT282_03415 [Bifidobacterium sp. ESL0763]|uniref:DUF4190 domain-containing protein n=1 Tax=Bifidobacterium sp. ESL0763 TaxID=2983227 RepID=UPI0023F834A4|nr:hypothetical protein [Bifidobacterium sp. ESL0763]MDF7663717.1 hypothetical protein [Bifidobacterium sp. ESL0763]